MPEAKDATTQVDLHGGGEIAASHYYSDHDLREMFSRENAERRRQGAKTLRKYLTAKQDKSVLNKMVRIREEYEVCNNDDVILVWAQQMIKEGEVEDIHPAILKAAEKATIPKRKTPFSEQVDAVET